MSAPSLPLSVEGQAHRLISEAASKENLGMMYIWCAAPPHTPRPLHPAPVPCPSPPASLPKTCALVYVQKCGYCGALVCVCGRMCAPPPLEMLLKHDVACLEHRYISTAQFRGLFSPCECGRWMPWV